MSLKLSSRETAKYKIVEVPDSSYHRNRFYAFYWSWRGWKVLDWYYNEETVKSVIKQHKASKSKENVTYYE